MPFLTEADIQALIDEKVQESLVLEYKSGAALDRSDAKKKEIAKDVSALANSAGGQLIYGLTEAGGFPSSIDGVDSKSFSKEWLEQVIQSNISPKIDGLVITPIPISSGLTVFVVDVPQATSYAPHQASDLRYYQRQNFKVEAMLDYQIRDIGRRATTPALSIDVSFASASTIVEKQAIQRPDMNGYWIDFDIYLTFRNSSPQPAPYAIIDVTYDTKLIRQLPAPHNAQVDLAGEYRGTPMKRMRRVYGPPIDQLPLFQEMPIALLHSPLKLSIRGGGQDRVYYFAYAIAAPGFKAYKPYGIVLQAGLLRLVPDSFP